MLLAHRVIALIMMFGGILFGIWLVTLFNDPICSASPEVAGGTTRVLQALALCWIG